MKKIYESVSYSPGYGAGPGEIKTIEYECPCGKGKIIEDIDAIPGFRSYDIIIECDNCREKYTKSEIEKLIKSM